MDDRELRRLSRSDLVDIIYELQKQNLEKEARSKELEQALANKELILSNAGSIAEAALQLNGVFEAAQAAADQYLLSLKASTEINESHQESFSANAASKFGPHSNNPRMKRTRD